MIRDVIEENERRILSEYAMLSSNTRGRLHPQEKCPMRSEFQRDRDRIIHCKAFRRLKHKTQVFMAPVDDHYRTRLTHTLEVSQIARTIARCLRLNEDLTEAISLGHDLGHTPFGHACERTLNKLMRNGFKHNQHSLRVVDVLENDYKGLNLTYEVRDGIECHTGDKLPQTLEGQIIRLSDRIAYINHDIDDAIRAKMLSGEALPKHCTDVLGKTHGERINTMIADVVQTSSDYSSVRMSSEIGSATEELRSFLFENVYIGTVAQKENDKACNIVKVMFDYFIKNTDKLPEEYRLHIDEFGKEQIVCDYIAGMTDLYAIRVFNDLFVPRVWSGIEI